MLSTPSAQKVSSGPTKKLVKPTQRKQETAQEGMEAVEFTPSPKDGERTPSVPAYGLMESDTDSDDVPLVSHLVIPVTIPIDPVVPSSGYKRNLVALLDSGCTWSSLP